MKQPFRAAFTRFAFLLLTVIGFQAIAQDKAVLDLSLEPPVINTKPGPEYDDAVRSGNMILGMDRTPKGRLWAAWVGNGDNPNGFFMLASSDDGGKTWPKPRVVIDPQDGELNGVRYERRALVGNLWTDPLGRLWCFFDQSLGYFDGRGGDWFTRCDDPDAAEPVWTKPVRFADGCTLNKPTVLSNGDWLLPVSLWTHDRIHGPGTGKEAHHDLDAIRMANVFASTDQGKTWKRRGGAAFPRTDFDEHVIVERKDLFSLIVHDRIAGCRAPVRDINNAILVLDGDHRRGVRVNVRAAVAVLLYQRLRTR